MKIFSAAIFLTSFPSVYAGPRTSVNYGVATDITDAGGKRATSVSYTNDGSLGGVAGVSSVASPVVTAIHGYIGQLAEVITLQLSAQRLTIEESGTLQLYASQLLDDTTTIVIDVNTIIWKVQSGPITSISDSGLATAGTVYQETSATLEGTYEGAIGTLGINVLDTIKDNFGTYAGDGIGDDWQNQYFGQNNPNAGPNFISDGSGLSNLFKYTAGLIPNNASSTFSLRNSAVPGQPTRQDVIFSPIVAGRKYAVQYSFDMSAGSWQLLTGSLQSDFGDTRIVTDPNATGLQKFYRVVITKP